MTLRVKADTLVVDDPGSRQCDSHEEPWSYGYFEGRNSPLVMDTQEIKPEIPVMTFV